MGQDGLEHVGIVAVHVDSPTDDAPSVHLGIGMSGRIGWCTRGAAIVLMSRIQKQLAFRFPIGRQGAKPLPIHVAPGSFGHLGGLLGQIAGLGVINAKVRGLGNEPALGGPA